MDRPFKWALPAFALIAAALLGMLLFSDWGCLPPVEQLLESAPEGVLLSGQLRWLALAGILFGTFASEDLACIAAGLLAGSGRLDFPSAVIAAFLGILIADLIIFAMGYYFGRPVLRHRWSRWIISERALDRAQELFARRGVWIILITRFIPGTRTATYFSAGALHAPVIRFVAVFALAAAIWTPLLVGASTLVGQQLFLLYELYEAFALPALLLAGLLLYLLLHYGIPLLTWRGRRRLHGKWLRSTRWEFWPVWQVNWLVLLYALYLGVIRHRRPMLVTAVNPCMPHGGMIGESKGGILANFSPACDALPVWFSIGPGSVEQRMAVLAEGMRAHRLSYPVVLKPDEGQRGLGVKVIAGESAAREWLGRTRAAAIVQEFVAGKEYGVFYVRKPSEPEGRILSITLKDQLTVTGNGHDTLEELIYRHPRAIALLDVFLARFADHLDRVPAMDEAVPLGELGTHALGALFRDGRHLLTPELANRVDRIAKACPGFWFGRFDIKAEGDEALKSGRRLMVLELNGVTSEATHIYDPRYGLLNAWRTLCAQWRLAYEIAAENSRAGAPVSRFGPFARDILAGLRRQRKISGS